MKSSSLMRFLIICLLFTLAITQPCDATCLTCSGSLITECISCDNDFAFDDPTDQCLPLANVNGSAYNTKILRIDDSSVADSINILSFSDGVDPYGSVPLFLADYPDSSITLYHTPGASQTDKFGVTVAFTTNIYKYSIKITGQLNGCSNSGQVNILRADVTDPPDYQILALIYNGSSSTYYKSTKYFSPNSSEQSGLLLTYSGSDLNSCGSITIFSIVFVGYICDSSCSCNYTTPCSCSNSLQYLTNLNKCEDCPTGCQTCYQAGLNITCTTCTTVGTTHYLFGATCVADCTNNTYKASNQNNQPVCMTCPQRCATCISSSNCITCNVGYVFYGGSNCGSCPYGQYANSTTTCDLCNSNCATCSSNSTKCASCGIINNTQYYLYSNSVCYSNCPNGSYALNNNGAFLCSACPTGCTLCSLNLLTVQCTECSNVSTTNFYLSAKSCLVTCPSGTYSNSTSFTCIACSEDCATCSTTGNGSCTSCKVKRLIYNTNTCGDCPSDQYADTAKTCDLCDSNCATCSSTPTNCVTCGLLQTTKQSYLYSDKKCYVSCPSGTYEFNNSGVYQCKSCPSGCATCDLKNDNVTVQCALCTSIAGVQFYLKGTSCVTVTGCGDGFYGGINSTTFEPTCIACVSPCGNCLSSSACLSCVTGALVLGTTYCTTQCPVGQFLNNTDSTCKACNSNCQTCSALTTCTSCGLIDSTQSYLYASNSTCYKICPNGSYALNNNGAFLCSACPTGCTLCSLNLLTVQCTECSNVSTTNFYLSAKSCLVTCPSGTYSNSTSFTCIACSEDCATCSTTGNGSCTSCKVKRLIYNTNTCGDCPSDQYADTAKTCDLCDSNCATCSSTPTNCVTCGLLQTTKQSYLYSDKKCYVSCPSGTYEFNNSGVYQCKSCPSGCATCDLKNDNVTVQCALCTSIAGVQFYLKGTSCVTVTGCGDGFYGGINSTTFEPTCIACVSPCGNCLSSSACLSCVTGALVLGTTYCTTQCPVGQFLNNTDSTCKACNSNCQTCSALTTCTSCGLIDSTQSYLYASNSTCYKICPNGSYALNNNGAFLCSACPTGCTLCSLNLLTVQCTECSNVSTTNFYLSAKSCLVTCPSGTYSNSTSFTCIACSEDCATCSTTGNGSCTSCKVKRLIYNTNTCGDCPSDQYADTAKTCDLCDSNCATCSSTPTNCVTCGLLQTTKQSYLYSDKKCYVSCPSGTYEFNNSGVYQCKSCPSGCATCDLKNDNVTVQCALCTSIAGVQFYLKGTSCVTVTGCGDGFYGGINSTTFEPTCIACVSPCGNCLSSSACLSCVTGALVLGTTYCTTQCPVGQFLNNTDSTCKACNSNCQTCSALTTCTSCGLIDSTQSYLYASNSTCYKICPNGSYALNNNGAFLCSACPTGCTLCSLNLLTVQCTECSNVSTTNFYLSAKSCLVTCPSGTYSNSTSFTCIACSEDCATCSTTGNGSCTSCKVKRLIYNTNTCGDCPSDQYADTAKTCDLCDSNCATCSSTPTNCVTCGLLQTTKQSYLYSDKKCYVSCPSGTYEFNNSGVYQCKSCPSGCATCDLKNDNVTVQCALCTSIAGVQFYLKGTSCVTVTGCGDGFYGGINSTTFEPTCIACVSPCGNCLSSSACLSCVTGALVLGTTYCTTQCPVGQFLNNTDSTCKACNSNCQTCSALTTCTSCGLIDSTQSYLYASNSTCYKICPNGSYALNNNGAFLCSACPTGCTLCSLNLLTVQCTECSNVSTTNFYLSAKSCLVTCPSGTYSNSTSFTCIACSEDCATCSTTGNGSCTSCKVKRLIYNTNTCGDCPSDQYADTAKTCDLCDSNCATCSSTPTNCVTCGLLQTTKQSYLYSDKKCYVSCPSGTYEFNNSGVYQCKSCPSGCATCDLKNDNVTVQCALCTSIAGVQFYLKGTSCVTVTGCGDGFYGGINSTTFEPTCIACVSPCGNCLSSSACLSCVTGVLVLGTTYCSSFCPYGQFLNGTSICLSCNSNCATCSSESVCTSCGLLNGTQAYLYSPNSTCYTICPNGSYALNNNGAFLCSACPTGCTLCSLNLLTVQCTECSNVSTTNFYLSAKSCLVTCPSGTYSNSTSFTCIACSEDCATCSTTGNGSCTSCKVKRLIYNTNTCGDCPSDQYADTAKTCDLCDLNCATCTSTPTNCVTCGLLPTLQSYLYSDKKCYLNCPTGYQSNNGSIYQCRACPSGCSACDLVSSAVQCTICTTVSDIQFYLLGKSCVLASNCGNGFYGGINSTTFQPACVPCVPPCQNCISSLSCLSCSLGRLISGGTTCSTDCPTAQYATSNATCALCNINCATCVNTSTTCLTCGILSGAQSYLYSDRVCYVNCPASTYKSSLNNTCQVCNISCNGCYDSSISCIKCNSTYYRVIGSTSCTQNCNDGFYGNTLTFTCTSCPIGCATCTMNSSNVLICTKCSSFAGVTYYLSGIQCVSLCASGTYQGIDNSTLNYTCITCTAPCKTCSGSSTYCTSCSTGNLIVGQNSCGSCPNGQYADSNSTCALCSPNCKTCSVASTNCTSCSFSTLGYQLFLHSDNLCYETCPNDYFGNKTSSQCSNCHASCQGCINSDANCIVCASTYYRVIGSNACTNDCGVGFYGNNNTLLCTVCPIGCSACIHSTVVTCSACQPVAGVKYYLNSTSCLSSCPLTSFGYEFNSTYSCQACNETCATCRNNTDLDCLSCSGTNYLSYGIFKCVSSCPDGQYAYIDNKCAVCNLNCLTCNITAINCLTCGKSPYGIDIFLFGSACIATCPTGYYSNLTSHQCLPCNSTCHTCSGPLPTNCLSCTSGSFLPFNNSCSTSCLGGQYPMNNLCNVCIDTCITCQNMSYCTSCRNISGQVYYLDLDNICSIVCPSGTYADDGTNTCIACTSPCKTCIGGTNVCTSCVSNSSTPYLIYGKNQCIAICPNGQYSTNSSNFCYSCSSNCLTCNNSATYCLTCGLSLSAGLQLYLSNNTCLANCPTNTYGASGNICSACDISCSGCLLSSTNCMNCNSSYYRKAGSTLCIDPCPSGYYGDPNTNLCTLCPSGCKVCSYNSTSINCTACRQSAGVFYYLQTLSNTCLPECPTKYYADLTSLTCLPCANNCSTCLDATNCLSCANGTLLGYGDTVCYSVCPDGQYNSNGSIKCQPCSTFCLTCVNSSTTCTTCTTLGGVAYYLSNNMCTATCPFGTYGNLTIYTCVSCTAGCESCYSSLTTTCYTCKAFNSSLNYYLVYGTNTCQANCPDGQYISGFKCLLCNSNCITCQTSSGNCQTCGFSNNVGANLYFYQNQCLLNCPNSYWGNVTGNNCDGCTTGCKTCFSSGLGSCTVCGNDSSTIYYKHIGSTVCNTTCPNGQFISALVANLCQPCSSTCVTCQGTAENCTSATCVQNLFFLNNECLSVCPNNYYADRTLRQCIGCATQCLTCFGSAATQCTVCNTSNYLQIGLTTCASGCNSGEFANSFTSQCTLCVSACATCTSLTVCQSCQSVNGLAYFLTGNSCNITCPSNQFGLVANFTCTNCSDGCATCFAVGVTNCYTCAPSSLSVNFFLIYGTNICNQTCPDGQYANSTSYKCLLCSANCLTCVNTSTTCTSCGYSVSGYLLYIYNNTCLSTCYVGFYRNTTTLSCDLCMSPCSSCQTYSLQTCSSCQNTNISGNITKYYKYIGDTVCDTKCPLGQFIDDTNSPNKCVMCDANCVGCVGSATNCTIVAGCKVNYFYNNATNSCVLICPDGTYGNVVTKFCQFCTGGCELCYGSGLSKCTKCINSSGNYYLMINLHQCSTTCNSGQYGDPTFFRCFQCNSACATCETLSNCTSCESVNGVAYFLNVSMCTVTCPINQYGNMTSLKCINCADQCATCFGGSFIECKTCASINTTKYYLIFGTNTCNLTCPDGQYANSTDLTCKLCNAVCLTCNFNSTYCLTCGFLSLGYNVYFYQNQCLLNCPNSYWGNVTGNNCDSCTIGCKTCFSSGLGSCTVCGNDSSTIYYKHIGSTVCNTTCPNGQFISALVANLCQPCSSTCVTCQGTAENCTSATCVQNLFFLNNECLSVCPNNYYADRTLRQCIGCATQCLTCFGSAATQCTVCNTSNYLQIGLTTCASGCNSGEFANSFTSQCTLCVSACATCTSLTVCQSCQSVNGLAYFLTGNSCNITCPSNQFGLVANFTCTNCSDGCATCFAVGVTNCYTCAPSSLSVNFFLIYGTNICNQTCPDGQYANSTSYKCLLCSANCLTCVNTSLLCLTCGFSLSGFNLYLFGTSCLLNCPNGYFANTLTNTCDPCQFGCATCTGSLLTNCTVCNNYNNSGTITPYYKILGVTTCSTICPTGQYILLSSNLCGKCDSGCISCAVTATNCTINACSSGFYYLDTNSSCGMTCPNNYYGNSTTGLCTVCTAGCQLCFGGGLNACTQCQTTSGNIQYFLIIESTNCSTTCPAGQYPYTSLLVCRYCSSPCLTCNTSDIDCQTCRNISGVPYFNYNNQCLLTCPDGYYGELSNNTCLVCPAGCSLCYGSILTKCTQCKNDNSTPYYLIYGKTICSLSCPGGQYSNATANSCFQCYQNCHTCINTSTICTTCTVTALGIRLFLQNNTCLQDCSISMYKYALNNTCLACNIGCLICTGPSLTQCQACRNYTDTNNVTSIYYLTIGNYICGLTCPIGQFIRSGYPNYCQPCSTQCIGCQTTQTNCIETYLCTVGFYFYRATNSCLSACPNGYYANGTTKYCQICPGGCSLCTAGNLNSCTACQTDPNTTQHYYKEIYMSSCVLNCVDGQFQVLSDHSCQPCHPSCVLCNSSSTTCQQCKNVSGQVYYYFAQQCLINCPNGMYGEKSNNTCVVCNLACSLCFGPLTTQCYSCRPDNSTGLYYYLSYGTNFCITVCPYGQYAVNGSYTCQPCNMNCATCYGTSTYCLTCTYVSTINIVFLLNSTCILVCPNNYWMNGTVALDHKCSPCNSFCLVCTGPSNAQCTVCSNQTINNSSVIYYKDLYSRTCNTTCPDGQFISAMIPNICAPCNSKCLLCSINSTNCFRCAFNYYLFVPLNNCVAQCPPNYYNDPIITANYYYCTQCTSGCLTCTGAGLTKCQTCQTVTNGTTVSYFKDPTTTTCSTTCINGYFGNILNNNCDPCQNGCVNCSQFAQNCFSCRSAGGYDYFKAATTNSCVTICPNGYYGNSTDYTCRDCIYYTLKGACILTCPSGTFAKLSGSKSICQNCSADDVTGNPCNRSYTIKVQTTVAKDSNGPKLVHKIFLSGGLSNNITNAQLRSNLSVNVVTPRRRRLMVQGRLLAVNTPLSVSDVSVSSDRTVIYITTNFEQFDFSTANVVVDFPAGSLVSSDGLLYQSTTASFPLSSPIFMQSYYNTFQKNLAYGAQGMIFVILSLLLLGMQLVIANRKGYHQALSFIMTLQVLGLMRAKEYPIDYKVFSVLLGYSYYQLSFIPNPFIQLFPPSYLENTVDSLAFTFVYQNIIYNLGSIIIIFISLQILLGIYFILKNDRPLHLARMKLLHETLVCLFMVVTLYFSCIAMMSIGNNSLSGMSTIFLGSILLALVLLIFYSIYFLVWVRPFRLFELYKVNNLCRVAGLVILTTSQYGGIIFIDLTEVLFIILEIVLYRHEKLNLKTYIVERFLIFFAFNSAIFSPNVTTLLGMMGSTMALVFIIKLYYTAITTKQFIDQLKIQQASEIDISDIVNVSVKDKGEDGNYAKLQAKQADDKMNHSDNFMYNESLEISQLQSQPTKHQILRMDVDQSQDREEEKKNNQINQESSSQQSQGELIVYLDPDDYKEEFLRKREQKIKEKEKEKEEMVNPQKKKEEYMRPVTQMRSSRKNLRVDGMKTGANFYPRIRGPQNHQIIEQDVEVIKVQPNNSQVDQSDIISENSEGFGWLDQHDERNVSRARQNKTVWKIMDEQENTKNK